MTTETQVILRVAPDALGAAGPAEHDGDAPTLSETEEKPPAPASKKHSGDPETTKGTSASKKHANDVNEEKKMPAPREADHRREDGGESTRFPEADCRCCPEEEDIRFYEAHAEDDEDDRFFEACAEETRGEETGCQAASEEERRHEGDQQDRAAASERTDVQR
ncbi:unnamed protein product [Phytophthora fragariaefolia]|uniref:Unnamed protein product n=1 Tax=Phytophthora fragariaefolia TaxID=1490495 RepID=A0A9W7DBV0_9STRA|nr:unnamed protein product [Phytophthora fragariaefolia]